MGIAFAGTAPFGASILRGLLDGIRSDGQAPEPRDVRLVISQPDRPAGRGRRVASSAVVELARERGVRLIQPERMHDPEVLALLTELGITTIVVAAFGQMIREPLLSDFLMINVHGSLLPAYRGAAPVERSIMDGGDQTGVAIMQMEAGLDTGPVAYDAAVAIGIDDDAGVIYARLADIGTQLLSEALDAAEAGTLTFQAQPDHGATYAHKITAADRAIDPTEPARHTHDRVRGLSPHVGAFAMFGTQRVGIWRTRLLDQGAIPEAAEESLATTGATWHDTSRLLMRCGDAALEVVEVQPPGKRRMPVCDWLRGLRDPLDPVEPPAQAGEPA